MKKTSLVYINSTETFEVFTELIHKNFNNINIDNREFMFDMFTYMSTKNIRGLVSFRDEAQKYFKNKRGNIGVSSITKEYWMSMGWSLDEAIDKVSSRQKKHSIIHTDYYTSRGLSLDEAKEKISKVQSNNSKKRYEKYSKDEISNQSVWSKTYWLDRGLSMKDAELEVAKRNYGKREFWSSDNEYEEIKRIIGNKTRKFIKENPEQYASFFGSISKEEIKFFNDIMSKFPDILHKQFIINVKETDELDQGIIKYDGYIKHTGGIILVEYDGIYWHNQSYDEIKDNVALKIRNDIIGIIRVSSEHYKTKRKLTIQQIQDGIEKIKNKESYRIKIY